jgi:hypothetical protein
MATHPSTNTEVIPVDQQKQSNKRCHNGQINHLIAMNWKALSIDDKRIKKPVPPTGHSLKVHQRQTTVTDWSKCPDNSQNTQ